jgi:outer membrane protein TolC
MNGFTVNTLSDNSANNKPNRHRLFLRLLVALERPKTILKSLLRLSPGLCAASIAVCGVLVSGCGFARQAESWDANGDESYYENTATNLAYPDIPTPTNDDILATPAPLTVLNESQIDFEKVSLEDVVHQALANSRVLRDMGAAVLRSPGGARTTYDVALQEMDPRFGVTAALSAFDASFEATTFVEKNDRTINNSFFGGGTRLFKQDLSTLQTQVSKRAATGTEFALRNFTDYDANNAPSNQFRSVFQTWIDAEVRHPLLQGNGTDFNRIAGPNGSPGAMSGVVLARLNTDMSLTDFEMGVRDFVSNVENAYWDLYFAYRDLDSKIAARDSALETWNTINALFEAGRAGGEAEKEAQAREQYYRFQEQVQNALSGRLIDGTRTNNGSSGGSFRGQGGVMTAERRLRLMMGVPINNGQLLRPSDEPIEARVVFDWDSILVESLTRRAELRRQKWVVKRREKELQASANFLLPTLDMIGRYRWRGFGHNYLPQGKDDGKFDNAWEDLFGGDTQEWQLGMELSMPFGRRQAHVAVDHAELLLAKERAILAEQEREVVHELSNAVAEMNRAWATMETSEDRRLAAVEQLDAVRAAYLADDAPFDQLLDAQRRFLDSETAYYRALVEYTVAIRNVHYEKGSLLDYNEIYLTENIWPMQAYQDAMARRKHTIPAEWLHGIVGTPHPVSQGPYGQNVQGSQTYAEPMPDEINAPPAAREIPAPAPAPGSAPAADINDISDTTLVEPKVLPPASKERPAQQLPALEVPQPVSNRGARDGNRTQPISNRGAITPTSFETNGNELIAPPIPNASDFQEARPTPRDLDNFDPFGDTLTLPTDN